ncbi:glycosyltransferase family 4 protein [Terrabacter terrigena]|uniref:D-inositol 3-phosphate glycosyltransferase n=1 Tax=Terrabacter terrigena TaxID=574718 RepID=A0ABW3MYZ4_9MICO
MRVLMVVGRAAGGVGAHLDGLVTGLRAEGHDVEVATADSTAEVFGWDDAHLLWPVHAGARSPRGLVDWHRIMRLAGTVDLVHAHGHQAAVVAAVAVARARPRPRLVVSLHNDLPPATGSVRSRVPVEVGRRAVGWALRRADLVTGASDDLVVLAESLGARRTELANVPSTSVAGLLHADRLPPGERARLLTGAGVPPDRPVVLTVSRIAPQKDLTTLVAAAGSSRAAASWVVVGDGDARLLTRLEEEAHGIREQGPAEGAATRAGVHFVGARDDVPGWLRLADVFVLTSRWEARALVVQEAMAAGVPVVATRTGGLPDLVGDTGVLVPVGDPDAVAAAVDRLLADPAARARLGTEGRSRAAAWASPEDEARRWTERYVDTLSG